MDTIAAYNYQPMLYTNINWICCHLNYDQLKDYPLWLAAYLSEASVKKYIDKYDMWQHSVAGHKYYDIQKVGAVPGITGQRLQLGLQRFCGADPQTEQEQAA